MSKKPGGLSSKNSKVIANSKIDDFRAVIRTLAADSVNSISAFLHISLDSYVTTKDKKAVISFENFQRGLSKFTQLKQKFSKADLEDIFSECHEIDDDVITIDGLADFCQRTISKARAIALKLRSAILKEFEGEAGFREAFSALATETYIDPGVFIEFAEDMLSISISDSDGLDLYSLYDMDGDKKVCYEDFLGFIVGKTAEGMSALKGKDPDAIVDIRISYGSQQDAELLRSGYSQISPNFGPQNIMRPGDVTAHGTFGKGHSMWVWRRKQGVCSGRLKPITDIQLESNATSSAMVLSGYTCVPVQVASQWLWLKRASTDEEEKDAIVDIHVTLGRLKVPSDLIWVSPGVGWIRVDGNFAKSSFLNQVDALVWLKPSRIRSTDMHMASPARSSVALSEEARLAKVLLMSRMAIRNHVPLTQLKKVANLQDYSEGNAEGAGLGSVIVGAPTGSNAFLLHRTERIFDFSALYNHYDSSGKGHLTRRSLENMLNDVGVRMDKIDVNRFLYFFNFNKQTGYISPQDFGILLKLSDFEVDLMVEKMRVKLLSSVRPEAPSDTRGARLTADEHKAVSATAAMNSLIGYMGDSHATSKLRENRLLSGVFKTINSTVNGILSLGEVLDMAGRLELFLTEEEGSRIYALMDTDGDEKITEGDFIAFMSRSGDTTPRKAARIKETAAMLRRSLLSGSAGLRAQSVADLSRSTIGGLFSKTNLTIEGAAENQWQSFRRKHERASGQRFPGYLGAENIVKAVGALGVNISVGEARELILLIAPEKRGRIQKSDLSGFISRTCRPFGVLLALLERDLLKGIIGAYRKLRDAVRDDGVTAGVGSESNPVLMQRYESLVSALVKVIMSSPGASSSNRAEASESAALVSGSSGGPGTQSSNQSKPSQSVLDVVSVHQLKTGIEGVYRAVSATSGVGNGGAIFENTAPNLEEWALLAILAGAGVCEEDTYGIRVRTFIDGICQYAVGGIGTGSAMEGKVPLEVVCRDLQRMIREEARTAALIVGDKSKKHDYAAAFNMFDEDGKGTISAEELKVMLVRLQLITQTADSQIPLLLSMFDKRKKGYITMDDFVAFAEAGQAVDDEDAGHFVEDEEDEECGPSSNKPPAAITKNADCDWLAWFLWRQACKLESSDPEGVITELEAACTETHLSHQEGTVSIKEIWNILCEMKLKGPLTKVQFEKCVKYVLQDETGKEEDHMVDYEALCRYTVRMGRAYNSLVQEMRGIDDKNYAALKAELKKELIAMMNTADGSDAKTDKDKDSLSKGGSKAKDKEKNDNFRIPTEAENQIPRFEKVMRRMDSDGDGKLTVQEFKVALKRLRFKDEKKWTVKMIRRLFEDFDTDRDGLLSVGEFVAMIHDSEMTAGDRDEDRTVDRDPHPTLSDDEDDAVFSKQRNLGSDSDLFKKINEVLRDIVPEGNGGESHAVLVQKEVRRFFRKHDTDGRGTVTEERFRSFCRRSGVQDRLTVAELRRLVDKLKKRRTSRDKTASVVDYEKFCHHLAAAPDSIPNSRSEGALQKLQDAVAGSIQDGRPFLSLCSLVDHRLSGVITREELMHTVKMMESNLTLQEFNALKEIIPRAFPMGSDGEYVVNYVELNEVLINHSPRNDSSFDRTFSNMNSTTGGRRDTMRETPRDFGDRDRERDRDRDPYITSRSMSALPSNTPLWGAKGTTLLSRNQSQYLDSRKQSMDSSRMSISTPGGYLSGPSPVYAESRGRGGDDRNASSSSSRGFYGRDRDVDRDDEGGFRGRDRDRVTDRGRQGDVLYDRVLSSIAERVTQAAADRGRSLGSPFFLLKQFEVYDDGYGAATGRAFENTLDTLGVSLSESELHVLYERFGRDSDRVDYQAFCLFLDDHSHLNEKLAIENVPRHRSLDDHYPQSSSVSPRYSARDRDRERDRGSVLGSGFDGRKSSHSSRGYNDPPASTSHPRAPFDVDPVLETSHVDHWLTHEASPREKKEFSNVYDSLHKFKTAVSDPRAGREGRNRDDQGDFSELDGYPYRGGLAAPKVTDSVSSVGGYSRPPAGRSNSVSMVPWRDQKESLDTAPTSPIKSYVGRSGYRYNSSEEDSGSLSPTHSPYSSARGTGLSRPSTSPSKMGTLMWGSDTPLDRKGQVPSVSDRLWCCAVCLYVENPAKESKCQVCDSPNYSKDKAFQVKEQCRNCTFLNGQFSRECEMCGEPISGGQSKRERGRERPLSTRY